jgi:uncharacterized protein
MQKAQAPFHIMAKPRGPVCNLACEYCYYLPKEKLYPGSDFRMSWELLADFTRQMIEAQPLPQVSFAWQGGEPTLMGLDFFEEALRLQNALAPPGMQISNALQTNGTLLTPAWCRFFKKHHFLIGLSLDGPPSVHNPYRVNKSGCEKFEAVMRAARLLKQHEVDFNILCCVHQANVGSPLEVYRFLRDSVGARFIQFIPIIQREVGPDGLETDAVTPRSLGGRDYGQFLTTIFDEWLRNDVGRVFVQIFDVALGARMHQPASLCIFAETCGRALVLEHNGDLYACDHFVNPGNKLGNIQERPLVDLVESEQQRQFGLDKREKLPEKCRNCPVQFICHGGCPKNRDHSGLNRLCEGYLAFFRHIEEPMQKMAALLRQGRAPAEIMTMIPKE